MDFFDRRVFEDLPSQFDFLLDIGNSTFSVTLVERQQYRYQLTNNLTASKQVSSEPSLTTEKKKTRDFIAFAIGYFFQSDFLSTVEHQQNYFIAS